MNFETILLLVIHAGIAAIFAAVMYGIAIGPERFARHWKILAMTVATIIFSNLMVNPYRMENLQLQDQIRTLKAEIRPKEEGKTQ